MCVVFLNDRAFVVCYVEKKEKKLKKERNIYIYIIGISKNPTNSTHKLFSEF